MTVTLGWQAEQADAVVVAVPVAPPDDPDADAAPHADARVLVTEFRVERTLKGDLAPGATLRVETVAHGRGAPWRPGLRHLLFLRRPAPPAGPAAPWRPVAGAFSLRPLSADGPEARFPDLTASLLAALESRDPARLRRLLVAWMEDPDDGLAWSAAVDFVRREDLHGSLEDPERARIVAAFSRRAAGKSAKGALALAAASSRSPAAARALADSLVQPGGRTIRHEVAEALRRIAAPAVESDLAARLPGAPADGRAALLTALAAVGGRASAPAVSALLVAEDTTVRTEAAATLGHLARNARAADPEARLGASRALLADLDADGAPALTNELRARLWALAQLDEEPAFAALRRLARDARADDVRGFAARLLERPRQSLVLR